MKLCLKNGTYSRVIKILFNLKELIFRTKLSKLTAILLHYYFIVLQKLTIKYS